MYTYKRVALIGVDGAGTFFRQTDTPNIDRIFENGSKKNARYPNFQQTWHVPE